MAYQADKATILGRIKSQCEQVGDCIVWTGKTPALGYVRISVGGQYDYIHRIVYRLEVGPIPAGMTIDHVYDKGCRHKTCVNPAHLEAVTLGENFRRYWDSYRKSHGIERK